MVRNYVKELGASIALERLATYWNRSVDHMASHRVDLGKQNRDC
jgi:hypothetical protein